MGGWTPNRHKPFRLCDILPAVGLLLPSVAGENAREGNGKEGGYRMATCDNRPIRLAQNPAGFRIKLAQFRPIREASSTRRSG